MKDGIGTRIENELFRIASRLRQRIAEEDSEQELCHCQLVAIDHYRNLPFNRRELYVKNLGRDNLRRMADKNIDQAEKQMGHDVYAFVARQHAKAKSLQQASAKAVATHRPLPRIQAGQGWNVRC